MLRPCAVLFQIQEVKAMSVRSEQIRYSTIRKPQTALRSVRSSRFALARLLWLAFVLLDLGLFTGGIFARHAQLRDPDPHVLQELGLLGLSVDFYAFYNITLEIIFALSFVVVGVIIFASASRKLRSAEASAAAARVSDSRPPTPGTHRQAPDWMALFVSLMLIVFGTAAYPIL